METRKNVPSRLGITTRNMRTLCLLALSYFVPRCSAVYHNWSEGGFVCWTCSGNWFGFLSQGHYWFKGEADFGLHKLSYSGMQIDGLNVFLVAVVVHPVYLQIVGKFLDPAINGEVVGLFY